jgi:chromosome segregation protein
VSKEGDLWRWDGFVRRADAPAPAAARLEHKNRLAAARKELARAEKVLTASKQAWDVAREARRKSEDDARGLRSYGQQMAAAAAASLRGLEQRQTEAERSAQRAEELTAQAQTLEAEIKEARGAQAGVQVEEPPPLGNDATLLAAREAVAAARAVAAEAAAAAQSLVRDRAQRDARRQAIAAESQQWRARGDSAGARLKAIGGELDEIERKRDAAKQAPLDARAKLEALMEEAGQAETRRAEASDRVAEAETHARQRDEAARAAEQVHASARESRAGAEAHAAAAAARVADIVAYAHEQTGKPAEQLASLAGALLSGALGAAPIHEVERRLERLKAERDAAGPVNLRAEEELAEAQQRIATLAKEKDDVAQAIAKLRRAITTLNNEGRARLLAAFEQVDAHFAQLFATLFEGGQANLKLTENEDPLEAGLEIFAEPPGKRLTNLSLLSGGEQALTATALIFAVFLANPAPLCVLDEMDAPLDDANVDRFCRLLEEMKRLTATRFVVITHNPVTMSRMDRLYGVTMPEQGVSQLVSVDLIRAQALAAE